MVIKYFFLFMLICASGWAQEEVPPALKKEHTRFLKVFAEDDVDPEKFSQPLKEWYWKRYEERGKEIQKHEKLSKIVKEKQQDFLKAKEQVVALEYKEDEADELEEQIISHIKLLQDKVYRKSLSVFIDYISWQRQAFLKSPSGKFPLIITSHGWCGGGALGYKNAFYHGYLDTCLMFGYGNVGAEVNNVTYKQSNVPSYGFKASLGGGMVVSSLGAEVGLKLPVFYSPQPLDDPNRSQFPDFTLREDPAFMYMISLYSRWPIKSWFIQTEYSRILGRELTYWGAGLGYTF